jgi:hypothetical protein
MNSLWPSPRFLLSILRDKPLIVWAERSEKKIERIEEKLEGVEELLHTLVSRLGNATIHERTPSIDRDRIGTAEDGDEDGAENAAFDGATTFSAHSELAKDLLERAVGNNSFVAQYTEMRSALASLRDIVKGQENNATTTSPDSLPSTGKRGQAPTAVILPSWEATSEVLLKAQSKQDTSIPKVLLIANRDHPTVYRLSPLGPYTRSCGHVQRCLWRDQNVER